MAAKSGKKTAKARGGATATRTQAKAKLPTASKQAAKAKGKAPAKDAAAGQASIVQRAVQFLREVKNELRKVAWPSRKQTISSTGVVLVLVVIISAFLGLVDMVLVRLVRLVIS